MLEIIKEDFFSFVKIENMILCCRLAAILSLLDFIANFNSCSKEKYSTCHFWVTPKVCFIFS